MGEIGVTTFCNFEHSRSLGTSLEPLTTTIGSRASLLQRSDLPIENALGG